MRMTNLLTHTLRDAPKDEDSINAQYLNRGGFIRRLAAGVYSYLPLGLSVLKNIEEIVREEMNNLGANEILMPTLTPAENWQMTGRWESMNDVFFKLKGAGDRDLALAPTHEEIVTPLIGGIVTSYRDLPVATYQINTKYRNEARAKSGVLRGREFRMKDLYSFHMTTEDLDIYYDRVVEAYMNIFNRCGIGEITYLTYASGGHFSKYSHEFQMVTTAGEDTIHICDSCHVAINSEIIDDLGHACPECDGHNLRQECAIEVGNIFKLMTRYSEAFDLGYSGIDGKRHTDVYMGCYGIGTTRLIGAVVEGCHDAQGIIWPVSIAPFKIGLINLASHDAKTSEFGEEIFDALEAVGLDVLYDDRDIRGGEKMADMDLIGIPLQITVGPRDAARGMVEIKERASGAKTIMGRDDAIQFLLDKLAE